MRNKLIAACIAAAAVIAIAALPSGASAAPCVTDPAGTCLATGNKITLTQHSNQTVTTPQGTFTCTALNFTGTLLKNSAAEGIQATISSAAFTGTGPSGRCTTTIPDGFGGNATIQWTVKLPICLTSVANNTAKFYDGDCTQFETGPKFAFDVFTQGGISLGECEYERQSAGGVKEPLTATYNLNVAPATAEWESAANGHAAQFFARIKGGALVCPANFTLGGSTTVFTDAVNEPGVSIS